MYNTAGETDMAKNLKVVLKVLHLLVWSTTIGSKLKAEVGEGLQWQEINQEDPGDSKQGNKKPGYLRSNSGLFSVGIRRLYPAKVISVITVLKYTITLAPNGNFRSIKG